MVENVAFQQAGAYLDAPAGIVDLAVRLAGTDTTALAVPGVTLAAGQSYTLTPMGLAGGMPTLVALPLVDS